MGFLRSSWLKNLHKVMLVVLSVVWFGFDATVGSTNAQETPVKFTICVTTENSPSNAADSQTPVPKTYDYYSIEIRNTPLIGLIFPQSSFVSVYSDIPVNLQSDLIAPDANSGGYLFKETVGTLRTVENQADPQGCAANQHITHTQNSLSLYTDKNYALKIQVDKADALSKAEILGAFAFHFALNGETGPSRDFQILQLDDTGEGIQFKINDTTKGIRFRVIGNHDFEIRQLGLDKARPESTGFSNNLLESVINLVEPSSYYKTKFFNELDMAGIRFFPGALLGYPDQGFELPSYLGGYIYLRVDKTHPRLAPIFKAPDHITTLINGLSVRYTPLGRPDTTYSSIKGYKQWLEVVETDTQGQLIIKNTQVKATISSWLMIPCSYIADLNSKIKPCE